MNLPRTLILAALLLAAPLVHALEIAPYTADKLAAAQAAGKPVALHFHADWCPTCRAQAKTLAALTADKALDLTVLVANYDTEKALKHTYGVREQSTLIVFRGRDEKARLVGETTAPKISAALKAAL